MAEDLPIIKIVDSLIFHGILQNASDIHIEPGEKELTVRYRIDGILHDAMILDKNAGAGITARVKVLSNLKLDEKDYHKMVDLKRTKWRKSFFSCFYITNFLWRKNCYKNFKRRFPWIFFRDFGLSWGRIRKNL